MEKDAPICPKFGEIPEARKITPHITQAGSPEEFLQRRLREPKNQQVMEGSFPLAQWESQWQQFLTTLETSQPEWEIPPLPEKTSPWENAKAFLASFEQVAEACQWPQKEWVTQLQPALSGEAEKAFKGLGVKDREDYGKVKVAILRGDALNREKQRQEFRHFCYQEAEGPRGAYSRLREMCYEWLRVENHSKEEVLELLILEQLLNVLPLEIQSHVRESSPESCSQVVALAEEFLLRQEKQVPLKETAGSISEAGDALSERDQRHLPMDIKEEESKEAGPLARSTEEMAGELQRTSLEIALEKDSEGNCCDPHGIKRKEAASTDEKRDKPIPFQGGGSHEIPEEERPAKKRKNEDRCSSQRVHCREKENESLSFGKTFIHKRSDVFQEQIHSGEEPCNCLECGKSFGCQTALASHQKIHSGCDGVNEGDKELCGLPLGMKGNFWNQDGSKRERGNHLAEKKDQPYPCQERDFCDVTLMGEETYKCLEFGVDFPGQAQYNTHLQKNSGKNTIKCLECGKSFSGRSQLLRHQRIHIGGKLYSCSPCGKSFSHKGNPIQPQRINSQEKSFICSGNGKSSSDGKMGHVRFPKHSRMKTYKCFQCGTNVRYKSQLRVHQRKHTGEKPFECSECGKKFSQNYDLQRHLRIHTGEKPFECSGCGRKFSQSYNLQMHLRTHTGEKPFECSGCGKKFSKNYHLKRHQIIHRREKPFE